MFVQMKLHKSPHDHMLVQIKFYELPPGMLFVHYCKSVLKHTCNIFTNYSHVIVTKFCVNEYYIHF